MVFISPEYHTKRVIKRHGGFFIYAIILFSLVVYLASPVLCDVPKEYRIGDIDPSFGYSERVLLDVIKEAENIWESGLSRDVLRFNAKEGLPISLVYDDRQARTDEIGYAHDNLQILEIERQSIQERFSDLSEAHRVLTQEYNEDVADYERDIIEFNKTVEFWNKKQGAPKETFELIKKEQKELEVRQAQLEFDRKEINRIVEQLNSTVQSDRQIVNTYNKIVNSFEERYDETALFDRASFSGEGIEVYEFPDRDILVLSLVHEFGHYLGIDHVEDSTAIMHFLMKDQDLSHIALTDADVDAFKEVCSPEQEKYFARLYMLKNYIQNSL